MQTRVVSQLPITQEDWSDLVFCYLRDDSDGILGITCVSHDHQHSYLSPSISFMQVDLNNGAIISDVSYPCSCEGLEAIHLVYDRREQVWLITLIETFDLSQSSHIVLYKASSDGHLLSESPLVIDEAVDSVTDIGPLLLTYGDAGSYRVLYLKPKMDNMDAPDVLLGRLIKAKGQEYFSREEITIAEKSFGYLAGENCLLLACRPEYGEFSEKVNGVFVGATGEWRISMMGWKGDAASMYWKFAPNMGFPVGDRRSPDKDFDWLIVGADAIGGPTLPGNGRHTWVVGIVLIDTFDYKAHGYTIEEEDRITKNVQSLFCIDAAGKVVQVSQSPVGPQLDLCLSGTMVVGVDLLDDRRRLWNWFPLHETQLRTVLWLDQQVLRATVVAEKAQEERRGDLFWLVEEYSDQVRISKRDAFTLTEVSPAVVLADVHLISKQKHWRYLEWEKSLEAIPYQGRLFLLGVDKNKQSVLYQIE